MPDIEMYIRSSPLLDWTVKGNQGCSVSAKVRKTSFSQFAGVWVGNFNCEDTVGNPDNAAPNKSDLSKDVSGFILTPASVCHDASAPSAFSGLVDCTANPLLSPQGALGSAWIW